MASAEDYAAWIVANKDKQGTPDFEKVAAAYKVAKQGVTQKAEDPTSAGNLAGAAIEPNLSLLTGMFAQPVAGLAGLATSAGNALGLTKSEPADVVRNISGAMTYEPKTTGGKNAMSVVGYLPEKFGELAHSAGEKVSDVTGSPALGTYINTGLNVIPAILGAKGSSTLSGATGAASERLMRSALKPSADLVKSGDAAKAIQTLLDEGVNVTPGGANKVAGRISSINDQIAEAIVNSNARVPKIGVANRLQDLTKQVEKQVNPNADMKAVEAAYNEFADHPLIPGADLPVQLAQEMKQGTYRRLRDKYGEMGNADTEAQKGLARGLKEEIATAVPEVGPLNARESELLNAKKMLDHRVAVAGNHNPIGITHLSPGLGNLIAGLLDRSELVKSLMARGLNPGKDLSLSDMAAVGATAPQTFSDDMQKRKAVIAALMGAQQ
jgi:hypothetical protein